MKRNFSLSRIKFVTLSICRPVYPVPSTAVLGFLFQSAGTSSFNSASLSVFSLSLLRNRGP